ncbi:protein of unknown function DUF107 [Denitrovibrio acetiphilus DSM 12809]|uniref:Uncharacterized protein n=1 Tax=Denitrovibrio acetiphilus (strain DSM 12809 / NBRC 114555 / N2460) TaxID=522772 RepID=D4H3Z8_DENA2|nr:nodulation protein NfeD [Denitrovibrio acetiphilus]ADD67309.1 protein of unknown function DUF107 [Denitrovibrio acetiphilus DSM 12809]
MKKLLFLILMAAAFTVQAKDIFVITVDGVITGYTEKYIETSLKEAKANGGVLLIQLDTPGGILDSTRGIVQVLLESDTPVIIFVSPQGARAGSAGTFIVLASHYAAMAEGTNIGAAHPVNVTGKDLEGHMAQKIENDTVAFMRSIAEKRGRDVESAVSTVTDSKSYTAKEALSLGLVDQVTNTIDEVSEAAGLKLGFQPGKVVHLTATPLQKVAFFLSDPNVLVLLLFIGILAIFLEFKIPGTFIFAAVGIAAILLFLMGINIIPVNSIALLLIVAGIGLLAAEIFVPSFGLLTVASIASLGAGMYLLFSTEGNMGIAVSIWLIVAMIGFIVFIMILIGRLLLRDFRRKPATGKESLKGLEATVTNWNDGHGHVFVHGEIWGAQSDQELTRDEKVIITAVEGMKVKVEKKNV